MSSSKGVQFDEIYRKNGMLRGKGTYLFESYYENEKEEIVSYEIEKKFEFKETPFEKIEIQGIEGNEITLDEKSFILLNLKMDSIY